MRINLFIVVIGCLCFSRANGQYSAPFGIGTSTPGDHLHVVGANSTLRLASSVYYGGTGNDLNAVLGTIKFGNHDANSWYRAEIRGVLTGGWADHVGLTFLTAQGSSQVERMRITHSGYVGIGTQTPSSTLTVASPSLGSTDATLRLMPVGGGTSNSSQFSIIDLFSTFDNYPSDQGSRRTASLKAGFSGGVWGNEFLSFHVGNNGNSNDGGSIPIERLRSAGNGNFGIGTLAPQAKLDVSGSIKIPAATSTDNLSPGLVLLCNDDFLYDGEYINHYGFGFHHFSGSALNGANAYVSGFFGLDLFTEGQNRFRILRNGNIGIGVINPTAKLEVDGSIISEEIKVQVVNGPDYVFAPDYSLPTLEETKAYIEANHHLPEIPSAKEMEENGVALGEMNMLLLKKIEELTLHQIELLAEIKNLKYELKLLKDEK